MLEIAVVLAVLGSVYNFMLSVFTADDPSWKCTRKNNSSEFCIRHGNGSILSNSDLLDDVQYSAGRDTQTGYFLGFSIHIKVVSIETKNHLQI